LPPKLFSHRDSQHCHLRSSPCEIAPAVPFSDLELTFFEVDGVAGDKAKWKTKMRRICQRANARFLAICRFCGRRKIMDLVVRMK
jgi:hypothetical protein